jgi:hypothetical protein
MKGLNARPEAPPSPWPTVAAAAAFLHDLAADNLGAVPEGLAGEALARWLIWHELGPLAQARWQGRDAALASLLRRDLFAAAAENSLLFTLLAEVLDALDAAGVPVVALKGVALAGSVYDDPAQRPMSDVDLWVPAEAMKPAVMAVSALGYHLMENPNRPLCWQALAGGELQLVKPGWTRGLLELHWTPFEGDWLRYTAAVAPDEVWDRRRPLTLADRPVAMLAPEDAVIHLALHLVTGPKFGRTALRTCVDLSLLARRWPVDWGVVLQRARQWQVVRAVSCVLGLAETLVGLEGLNPERLAPPRPGLGSLLSPASLLEGRDWRRDPRGYLLLMLLTDRPLALLQLAGRLVWPERAWLAARYGPGAGIGTHWNRRLRRR